MCDLVKAVGMQDGFLRCVATEPEYYACSSWLNKIPRGSWAGAARCPSQYHHARGLCVSCRPQAVALHLMIQSHRLRRLRAEALLCNSTEERLDHGRGFIYSVILIRSARQTIGDLHAIPVGVGAKLPGPQLRCPREQFCGHPGKA